MNIQQNKHNGIRIVLQNNTILRQRKDVLYADCAKCAGVCCTALAFVSSADFALDKPAGQPCVHLQQDHRCSIHDRLRSSGFRGCTVYDCFGAGQKLIQTTFHGHSWREGKAEEMFEVFPILLHLQELLWYLAEVGTLRPAQTLHSSAEQLYQKILYYTDQEADDLLKLDRRSLHLQVNEVLTAASKEVSKAARKIYLSASQKPVNYTRGIDLAGRSLKGHNLIGTSLRGAYLMAADLRQADLRGAELIGADLRDTDVRGTNLQDTLFITQSQINAAVGDADTQLPPWLERPAHWR